MRNRVIFVLAFIGMVVGLLTAYLFGIEAKPQPPAFTTASNPFGKGIYSNGIIESYQANGANINIYPEVSGTIDSILVSEGDVVRRGMPLLTIEDSVQRETTAQLRSQADAARALLEELRAQPRKETLEVAKAQVEYASAGVKSTQDQLDKLQKSYNFDPGSVSRDVLDNALNAVKVAKTNLEVVRRQYDLIKAGAWSYDIQNQERQYDSLTKASQASSALLGKYVVRASADGVVLSINAAAGSYISTQGAYDSYTQALKPILVMGADQKYLGVRCYIDEILVHRLPQPEHFDAKMFIRGTDINLPLEYVRIQPYVSPKIELSNLRTERVDVRVLPVLFRFAKPKEPALYPGQLVDVFIGQR